MNSINQNLNRPWSKWLLVASLPIAILAAAISYSTIREWMASRELNRILAEYSNAGVPVDRVSMKGWYENNTHPEGTSQWLDILKMLSWGDASTEQLPLIGTRPLPAVLNPAVPWTDLETVKDYLSEMPSVRDAITRAVELPTPVQFPMEFRGFDTLLNHVQESRTVLRFLALDFEYAYYTGDKNRALEDLRLMGGCAKAFECEAFIVSRLVTIALYRLREECIARSLVNNQWSEEELNILVSILRESHYTPEVMRNMLNGERAMGLDAIATGFSQEDQSNDLPLRSLSKMPSVRLKFLKHYDEFESLSSVPLQDLTSQAELIMSHIFGSKEFTGFDDLSRLLIPAIESCCIAELRAENNRKWRLTAVGLQLFQLKQGRWPTKLSELAEVGFSAGDYTLVNGKQFGYEVAEETAYLWTGDLMDEEKLSPVRPTPKASSDGDSDNSIDHLMELHSVDLKNPGTK